MSEQILALTSPNDNLRKLYQAGIDTINILDINYQYRYNGVNSTLSFGRKGEWLSEDEVEKLLDIDMYDIHEELIAAPIQQQMEDDNQVNHDEAVEEDEDDSEGLSDEEEESEYEYESCCNWNGDDTVKTTRLKEALRPFTILDHGEPLGEYITFDEIGTDS